MADEGNNLDFSRLEAPGLGGTDTAVRDRRRWHRNRSR
jgi:hypothetical protein